MSEEQIVQSEAPVSDAPAPSEPTSEPEVSSFDASFEAVHDAAEPSSEDGKWARPPEWKPGPAEAPADESEASELEVPEPEQQASRIQPPVSLSREAREHWANLPEPVKQFIAQRETQATQKISELAEYGKVAKEIRTLFQEFGETAPRLPSGEALPEAESMRLLLAANRALEQNPQEALKWLADSYGVDLGGVDTEQARQAAYLEAQEQHAWQEKTRQWEQHQQTQRHLMDHVTRFAESKGASWPQIEGDVLYHISALKALNPQMDHRDLLQAAYEKAVASRPDLDPSKKADQKKRADEARRISAMNVKSTGDWIARNGGSWQKTMENVYDQIEGRKR